jgi:hypothetical protein
MFRSSTIIRELVLSLAKVMLEHLCPYRLCGGVATCLGVACVLCGCGSMSWEWRVYCVGVAACLGSGVGVVCCAE